LYENKKIGGFGSQSHGGQPVTIYPVQYLVGMPSRQS
jgi:hypothetical protein